MLFTCDLIQILFPKVDFMRCWYFSGCSNNNVFFPLETLIKHWDMTIHKYEFYFQIISKQFNWTDILMRRDMVCVCVCVLLVIQLEVHAVMDFIWWSVKEINDFTNYRQTQKINNRLAYDIIYTVTLLQYGFICNFIMISTAFINLSLCSFQHLLTSLKSNVESVNVV